MKEFSETELPPRIAEEEKTTLRPVNPGAEKWLNRPIPCLDYGFVYLVDYMGDDAAMAQAARTSYGKGTKKVSEDRGLIRHLMRHAHTSPIEMSEVKFHCKMPIFVARQWIRHRTANVNEYSGRYSEMLNEFYVPDPAVLKKQSANNRQGRDENLAPEQQARALDLLKEIYAMQYSAYEELLEMGVARELARIGLSVANYTQWYWKIDVHNLLHFLRLRLDAHAQYEIRVFGEAMARVIRDAFPLTYEAFEDYQVNALKLSGKEIGIFRHIAKRLPIAKEAAEEITLRAFQGNKREAQEFIEKLGRMGVLE